MVAKNYSAKLPKSWKHWFLAGGSLTLLLLLLVWLPARSQGRLPANCAQQHVIRPGETLSSIARRYQVEMPQLMSLNKIANPNRIYAGTQLCIRLNGVPAAGQDAPAAGMHPSATIQQPHAKYHPSPVVLWNEAMLAAVRNGAPRPTVTARSLYMVHQAIYDAWSVYDPMAQPVFLNGELQRPPRENTEANKAAAVSQAAYQMLITLFPAYETQSHAFSSLLEMQGYAPLSEAGEGTTPDSIGFMAAQAVLAGRENDGSNAANNYADMVSEKYPALYEPVNSADPAAENSLGNPGYDPNHWQPLRVPTGVLTDEYGQPAADSNIPESYVDQKFLTPHWGAITPFALLSGDQFRPSGPPLFGSDDPYVDALGQTMTHDEAFHQQVSEHLKLSSGLTDRQKVIAEYWADGPRSETPPGHWNALVHGISERDNLGIDEDVMLYFALNGALFDASISAWDSKRAYDYVRPVTAVRALYAGHTIPAWAGPDQGTRLIPAEEWRPYQDATFVTPPFAEYVSGHSTFSAAAAEVLTRFTGSNTYYDGRTILYFEDYNRDGVPDILGQHVVPIGGNMFESSPTEVIVLQWPTFQDAADEAGLSRRYGGIHFQDGDLRGREMGTAIGAQAFELAERYWSGHVGPAGN